MDINSKKSLSHVLQNLNVRESWPFAYFEKCIIRFSFGFSFGQFCTLPCLQKKPADVHFLLLNRLVINPLLRVIYSVCSESLPAPIYFLEKFIANMPCKYMKMLDATGNS